MNKIEHSIKAISGKEFLKMALEQTLLVDVRPQYEMSRFFDIENLFYGSYLEVETWHTKLPKNKLLIIADATGIRSKEVAVNLVQKGYSNIYLLAGGLVDWERANLPIRVDKYRILTGGCMCQLKPRNLKEFYTREATASDMEEIKQLLLSCNLPVGDISITKQHFYLTMKYGKIVACCAIEPLGEFGLFRSFAVSKKERSQGLGKYLYNFALEKYKQQKSNPLYLLTTTAEGYFAKLGWEPISRELLPTPIIESSEFKDICPQSAVCMQLMLL